MIQRPGIGLYHQVTRTSVVARLGTGRPPVVALQADMDVLPIHSLPLSSHNILHSSLCRPGSRGGQQCYRHGSWSQGAQNHIDNIIYNFLFSITNAYKF